MKRRYSVKMMVVLVACCCFGLVSADTQVPTIVGKVVWVQGAFEATSADTNQARTLAKTDPIYLHDTLITAENTQAEIVFTDNTLMTFRPDTKFYIKDYAYDSKATSGSVGTYVVNLIEGGFRTITGFIAKANPSDYQVNTPVATIGVRGTDYTVYVDKTGGLYVGYYHGSPCVSNQNKTMCLDDKKPYANVPNANSVPVPVSQRPAVFEVKQVVNPITFTGNPGANVVTPDQAVKSIMSSFCIQ